MKVTFEKLIASLGNTTVGDPGAFARFRNCPKPLATAIRMKSITRRVNELVEDYNEQRIELCKKHGKLDEVKNVYQFGDNQAAFDAEYHELMAVEVEIPGDRIKVRQLLSSMAISEDDLDLLEWLIDTGEIVEAKKPAEIPAEAPAAAESEDLLELNDEQADAATA